MLEARAAKKPTITLTPLIDVVFILLIFFMLVMQFESLQQLPISLVQAADQQGTSQLKSKSLSLKINANGSCDFDGKRIECLALVKHLPSRVESQVNISFDAEVLLKDIVLIQDRLTLAGVESALLITDQSALEMLDQK